MPDLVDAGANLITIGWADRQSRVLLREALTFLSGCVVHGIGAAPAVPDHERGHASSCCLLVVVFGGTAAFAF